MLGIASTPIFWHFEPDQKTCHSECPLWFENKIHSSFLRHRALKLCRRSNLWMSISFCCFLINSLRWWFVNVRERDVEVSCDYHVLSMYFCSSWMKCLMEFSELSLGAERMKAVQSSWLSEPLNIMSCSSFIFYDFVDCKSIVCDMRSTGPALFCGPLSCMTDFHSCTWSMRSSCRVRGGSCTQHMVGLCLRV